MSTSGAGRGAPFMASWNPTAAAAVGRALASSAAVKATTPPSRPGAAGCCASPTCQARSSLDIR